MLTSHGFFLKRPTCRLNRLHLRDLLIHEVFICSLLHNYGYPTNKPIAILPEKKLLTQDVFVKH